MSAVMEYSMTTSERRQVALLNVIACRKEADAMEARAAASDIAGQEYGGNGDEWRKLADRARKQAATYLVQAATYAPARNWPNPNTGD